MPPSSSACDQPTWTLPDISDVTPLEVPSMDQLVQGNHPSWSHVVLCMVICILYVATTIFELYLESISKGLASFRPTAGVGAGILLILGKLSISSSSSSSSLVRTGFISVCVVTLSSEMLSKLSMNSSWSIWMLTSLVSTSGTVFEFVVETWLVQSLLKRVSHSYWHTERPNTAKTTSNSFGQPIEITCISDPLAGVARIICLLTGVIPACVVGSWINSMAVCVSTSRYCLNSSDYSSIWLNRFLADLVGVFLVAPWIVCVWTTIYRYMHPGKSINNTSTTLLHRVQIATFGYAVHACSHPWICRAELVTICAEVVLVNCLVFGNINMNDQLSFFREAPAIIFPFLSFLPPMLRWGSFGTTIAVLTGCTIATIGTLRGLGPLADLHICQISTMMPVKTRDVMTTTIHLQWFILTNTLATLLLCGFFADLVRVASSVDRHVSVTLTRLLAAKEEAERLRDEAQAALVAKHRFLSSMSHEMRTPLNGVLGMVQSLSNTGSTVTDEHLSIINKCSNHLLSIMNNVLDVSRLELESDQVGESIVLQHQDVDMHVVMEEAVTKALALVDHTHLDVVYMVHPDVPAVITTDGERLQQILLNLIINGIHFTKHGGVTVSVHVNVLPRHGDDDDDHVSLKFVVSDTGIGIPQEDGAKLFQPFAQLDTSSTRGHGGCGLGLVLCSRLVALFHGTIWLESEVGVGSKFYFTIKCTKPLVLSSSLPSRRLFVDHLSALEGKRLLIVDHNSQILLSVQWFAIRVGLDIVFNSTRSNEAMKWMKSKGNLVDFYLFNAADDADMLVNQVHTSSSNSSHNIFILCPPSTHPSTAKAGTHCVTKPLMFTDLANRLVASLSLSILHNVAPSNVASTKKSLVDFPPVLRKRSRLLKKSLSDPSTPTEQQPSISFHILVAEDNIINQKVLANALNRLGHTYDIAENGQVAVDLAKSRAHYDLVLMDLHMPVMDGFDACRVILTSFTNYHHHDDNSNSSPLTNCLPRHPPMIIGISASVLPADIEACYESGMVDYIAKPFSFKELAKIIQKWGIMTRQTHSSLATPNNTASNTN